MTLVDAHCHLANLGVQMPLETLLDEAGKNGIKRWLSSALTRSELSRYAEFAFSGLMYSAGVHPNFDECDLEIEDIARLCEEKRIWAVGEIGLDRNGPEIETQKSLLIKQLELAVEHGLPVVLHIVGHQQAAYEILKRYPLRYLVHGYAGSLEGYRLLARLDSFFTISERILKPDKTKLLQEMVADRRYLAETDMTRYYVLPGEKNPLLRLLEVAEKTLVLCGISENEFSRVQNESFQALTGVCLD